MLVVAEYPLSFSIKPSLWTHHIAPQIKNHILHSPLKLNYKAQLSSGQQNVRQMFVYDL